MRSRVAVLVMMAGLGPDMLLAQRTAVLAGKVFVDTLFQPLSGVEIRLPEAGLTTSSDAKGAFRVADVPAGRHQVQARKIGYATYVGFIDFAEGTTVQRAIVLPRLTALDTVRIVGDAFVPLSFLENKAVGLGHFITRDELERQGNRKLADIVSMVPGLGIVQGRNSQGWILSKRYTIPLRARGGNGNSGDGSPVYFPESFERMQGMKAGCYAHVYLDNALLNPGFPAQPVDLNQFFSQQIEAIEYYAGPAQTPARYSRLNSQCGVLVLHTRRSP